MKKYNGINLNNHYIIENGAEYWFIYEQSDNPDESADVVLFPGYADEILFHNVDLGSCGYILCKSGESRIQCSLPLSSNILGEFFVDTDFPLQIHECSYTRYDSEIDDDYHIYTDTTGFCAAKQSFFSEDREMAAAAEVCFEPGCKILCNRTVEKIYSVYHGVDITSSFLEYLEAGYKGDIKDASKLFRLLENMSFTGAIRFAEGDIIFDCGIFGRERTMRILEKGKEEKSFHDDEKESAFMNWVL